MRWKRPPTPCTSNDGCKKTGSLGDCCGTAFINNTMQGAGTTGMCKSGISFMEPTYTTGGVDYKCEAEKLMATLAAGAAAAYIMLN